MRPIDSLNAADLRKMKATEVANLADIDFYAVREEGFRRQSAAEAKIAKLQKQIAAAQTEMAEAGAIITAAFAEQQAQAEVLTVEFNARRDERLDRPDADFLRDRQQDEEMRRAD